MRIRTDDEVYRVDAVWLGPPKATFPWRARYVAWGVGTVVFLLVLTVFRQVGIGLFWSISWGLVVTIFLTMLICSRISHERPLSAVLTMWARELTAPREVVTGRGGAVSATQVGVRAERPRRTGRGRSRSGSRTESRHPSARRKRSAGLEPAWAGKRSGRSVRGTRRGPARPAVSPHAVTRRGSGVRKPT